jgi:hypothetical protein
LLVSNVRDSLEGTIPRGVAVPERSADAAVSRGSGRDPNGPRPVFGARSRGDLGRAIVHDPRGALSAPARGRPELLVHTGKCRSPATRRASPIERCRGFILSRCGDPWRYRWS